MQIPYRASRKTRDIVEDIKGYYEAYDVAPTERIKLTDSRVYLERELLKLQRKYNQDGISR
jgi:Zn/Cd-binding protein ZinT